MRVPRLVLALVVVLFAASLTSTAQAGPFGYDLVPIGVDTLPGNSITAEIVSYDPVTSRMAVVDSGGNAVHIVSLATPSAPADVTAISMTPYGGIVNSVVGAGGYFAAAVENTNVQLNGRVVIIDAATATVVADVEVGVLPDAVTITPDGQRLVVANEGQPACVSNAYVDPEGSVSVITKPVGGWPALVQANVAQATFTSFNASIAALRAAGVRIFGPGSTVAQDVEPEYAAATNTTAWVTLQEANAIATVDLLTATVTAITPLGTKDHSVAGNALDPSDRDNGSGGPAINIVNRPVQGMYQPDGIATFEHSGTQFIITANEGDSRNYGACLNEEIRVSAATVGAPLTAADQNNAVLGRMQVTNRLPDGTTVGTPGNPPMTVVNAYGARSFTVRNAATGAIVWDSGDAFEQLIKLDNPSFFNTDFDGGTLANFDLRSDNKGPEPESVVVGDVCANRRVAFVGLERSNGVMVYDITDPTNPQFSEYERSTTNYPASTGDIAPEGLAFVPAGDSPNGNALLLVANELSGTTRVMQIVCAPDTVVPEVPLAALLPLSMLAIGGVWAWRRQTAH